MRIAFLLKAIGGDNVDSVEIEFEIVHQFVTCWLLDAPAGASRAMLYEHSSQS
jgi:hypothetical protein